MRRSKKQKSKGPFINDSCMARDPIMALVADQHTARKNFFLKLVSQTRFGTAAHKVSGHTFFYKPF